MGWDVLVFKLKDPSTPAMELDESKVLALGEPVALRQAIDAVLPGVDWSDPTWGYVKILGCHLEFNLRGNDPLHMGIHVHGHGDPITPIVALCKAHGWCAFDTSAGEFLDLDRPSAAGWEAFEAFRDKAIRQFQSGAHDHLRKQ